MVRETVDRKVREPGDIDYLLKVPELGVMIEHEVSGLLVPPGDSESLAAATVRLLENQSCV